MGIRCRHLSEAGCGRRQPERRSKGASQSSAPGAFPLGRLIINPRWPIFFCCFPGPKAHTLRMTTVTRLSRRCGWWIRCASVALSLVFCASLFADPSNNVVVVPAKQQQSAQKKVKKVCYVITSASGIPMPCERLAAIPTTASPMLIFGHATAKQ